ncbi:hypothetical protein B0H14DRAFT_2871566 [Mycena olivaceomarginata]|nr:hypothetical protein B0H14DRAFT_2871566 [Mycena olivaceomarginata]
MRSLGTVAFGTSSFPHKVVLSMKSYEDSGESMKIGWIVAPGVSTVLGMIFYCPAHRLRCAPPRTYVCTFLHVLGWVVFMTMAHCPALCAGGSMMNARGRDGTSDDAGRLRLGTVRRRGVTAGGCAVRTSVTPKRWQMRRRQAAQASDCSSDSHLPGYFVSVVGQGGAAPAQKWQC